MPSALDPVSSEDPARPKVKNLLTLSLSVLVALLIAECLLRFLHTPAVLANRMEMLEQQGPTDVRWRFDFERFAFEPNQEMDIRHGEYQYIAHIDDEGWRNPCAGNQNPRFLVGDSFVLGLGVVDHHTLQCELSELGVNVYAAGVTGADATVYLKIIEKHGARLMGTSRLSSPAELIMAIFMGNDFESLVDFNPNEPRKEPSLPSRIADRINHILGANPVVQSSYMLQLVKLAVGPRVKVLIRGTPKGVVYLGSGSTFYARGTAEQAFVASLDRFFEALKLEAKKAGLEPITLLLIPDVNEISDSRRAVALSFQLLPADYSDPRFKQSVIRKAAARHGFGIIDGYDCLTDESMYFPRDNHLSPAGTERLAKCISEHYGGAS